MNKITTELPTIIFQRKGDYYCQLANKLNDPKTNAKTYWFILKTFLNGTKIPVILPLLINGKLASDFKEKANKFNQYFALHCTPINNGSDFCYQ